MVNVEGRLEDSVPALDRALEIAEAAGATALIPRILSVMAYAAFMGGHLESGFAILERGWALARAAQDGPSLVWLAVNESDDLLKLARFQRAVEVASRGREDARQAGLQSWETATVLTANAAEALLALGRTAEAAAVIATRATTPPGGDHWLVQMARAEVELLHGTADAASSRQLIPAIINRVDFAFDGMQRAAEAALWAGQPEDAIGE